MTTRAAMSAGSLGTQSKVIGTGLFGCVESGGACSGEEASAAFVTKFLQHPAQYVQEGLRAVFMRCVDPGGSVSARLVGACVRDRTGVGGGGGAGDRCEGALALQFENAGVTCEDLFTQPGFHFAEQDEALEFAKAVYGTLQFFHARGVVHGDVHGGNVCWERRRPREHQLRLIDYSQSGFMVNQTSITSDIRRAKTLIDGAIRPFKSAFSKDIDVQLDNAAPRYAVPETAAFETADRILVTFLTDAVVFLENLRRAAENSHGGASFKDAAEVADAVISRSRLRRHSGYPEWQGVVDLAESTSTRATDKVHKDLQDRVLFAMSRMLGAAKESGVVLSVPSSIGKGGVRPTKKRRRSRRRSHKSRQKRVRSRQPRSQRSTKA